MSQSSSNTDPFAQALEALKRAQAQQAKTKAEAADGTISRAARAKELEAFPLLGSERGNPGWCPSYDDAAKEALIRAAAAVREAAVPYDAHEPRVNALRDRVRAVRALLTTPEQDERTTTILSHVRALRQLGVELRDLVGLEAQVIQGPIANELRKLPADLAALRAERQREGMPDPHLFQVARVAKCPPLMRLGVYVELPVLDGLIVAAEAGALTLEALDGVIAMLGTPPVEPDGGALSDLDQIKGRRERWEKTQRERADRVRWHGRVRVSL